MISLNGVILSNDLLWVDEFANAEVSQNIQRTVLGSLVISSFPKQAGRAIALTAVGSGDSYSGSFTREQVQGFKILEAAVTPVLFIYEAQSFTVIVQSGGVKVTPLLPRPNQANGDLYIGSLNLLTV